MFEVFIPYNNERVWQKKPILELLRQNRERSQYRLTEAFESWSEVVMKYDWGLEFDVQGQDEGMKFQFGTRRQAIYFKLTWA